MHRALCAALTDWLAGKTPGARGVNALLPGVPRDATLDPRPPAPVALFGDAFREDWAAANDTPPTLPAIVVQPDGPAAMDGEPGATSRRADALAVAVRVVVDSPVTAASRRHATYLQHAIRQSVAAFLSDNPASSAAREREGVAVIACVRFLDGPWHEKVGDALAVAVTAVAFEARDLAPRGAPVP